MNAARAELAAGGVSDIPQVVVADRGYWHQDQMHCVRDVLLRVARARDGAPREQRVPSSFLDLAD